MNAAIGMTFTRHWMFGFLLFCWVNTAVGQTGAPAQFNAIAPVLNLLFACDSEIPEGEWIERNNGGESVTLSRINSVTYEFSNFNIDYYDPSFNPIRGIFTHNCETNELTLVGQTEFDVQWRGSGTYDPVDPAIPTITFPQVEDIAFNPGFFEGPWVFEFSGP